MKIVVLEDACGYLLLLWMLPDALYRRIYLGGGKTLFLVPGAILKPV